MLLPTLLVHLLTLLMFLLMLLVLLLMLLMLLLTFLVWLNELYSCYSAVTSLSSLQLYCREAISCSHSLLGTGGFYGRAYCGHWDVVLFVDGHNGCVSRWAKNQCFLRASQCRRPHQVCKIEA